MPAAGKLELTPLQLDGYMTQIISEECNCAAAWAQHPGPLTEQEIEGIKVRVTELLMRCAPAPAVSR